MLVIHPPSLSLFFSFQAPKRSASMSRGGGASSSSFQADGFNTSLMSCTDDCASCMDVACCPSFHVSAQYNMLHHREPRVNLSVGIPLFLGGLFCFCIPMGCISVQTRSKARKVLQLSAEGSFESCSKAWWCMPCSMCQVYREMSIRHWWPGGVFVDIPYQKAGLVAPPPPTAPSMGVMGYEMQPYSPPPPPGQPTSSSLRQQQHNHQVASREQNHAPPHAAVPFSQLQLPSGPSPYQDPYGYEVQGGGHYYTSPSQGHPGPPPSAPVYGYEGQAPQYGRRPKQAS
ncbi:ama1 protein, putative [Bodo saltans]|uniref:Ama1 protein, putative n=1 Tax=Bodo saltans TaxID=75058 RepID=A0A0S4IYA4_BODSA|nr:ama1 protein, putative [Bodo saltans]|eukprot:CUG15001.1 ama1 protein, putative [Bodo saltans]